MQLYFDATTLLVPFADADSFKHAFYEVVRKSQVDFVRVLLQDDRLDVRPVIPIAPRRVVPLLIENERFGILSNREAFEVYHNWAVGKYHHLVEDRAEKIRAALWCMKEIGHGWGDLREPAEENEKAASGLGDEMKRNFEPLSFQRQTTTIPRTSPSNCPVCSAFFSLALLILISSLQISLALTLGAAMADTSLAGIRSKTFLCPITSKLSRAVFSEA